MPTSTIPNTIISSSRVTGTPVYSTDKEQIGNVDHLMIERYTGKVVYAVIGFGGFLGINQGYHPLPWAALRYDKDLGGYITGVTADQLRDAPEFSDDAWREREFEDRLHTHYGIPPYYAGGI